MGADIYLESRFAANKAKHETAFHAAVAARDALERGTPEADAAQAEVSKHFEAMYAEGYFRDPYNSTTFLAKINLSWWRDVIPMLNKQGYLPITRAKKFRAMIAERDVAPGVKKFWNEELNPKTREPLADWMKRYEEDKSNLLALLDASIELKEPLRCSL